MSTLTAPTDLGPTTSSPVALQDHHLLPPMGFRATGTLDRTAAGPFVALMASVTEDPALLVVDVRDVDVADTAGLRALDRLRDLRDGSEGVVLLRGISGARDEVLRVDRRLEQLRHRLPTAA